MIDRSKAGKKFGLPIRPFMYTIDQVSDLLNMPEKSFMRNYCYFEGIHGAVPPKDKILARNIDPQGESPDWRISEEDLIKWLKYMGFRIVERHSFS